MIIWKCRYFRCLYIGVSLLFLLILFIYFQIFKQSNFDDSYTDRPAYCDKTIIRQHFMNDKRYFNERK
jgi:hypothetical protein